MAQASDFDQAVAKYVARQQTIGKLQEDRYQWSAARVTVATEDGYEYSEDTTEPATTYIEVFVPMTGAKGQLHHNDFKMEIGPYGFGALVQAIAAVAAEGDK
jgi:hypothetical protein